MYSNIVHISWLPTFCSRHPNRKESQMADYVHEIERERLITTTAE